MADLHHVMGGDLALSATGDLLVASGAEGTKQRVLRRLLTNPGGYIWHMLYGAGLARFVGQPNPADRIKGVIIRQIRRERGVGVTPPPTVDVRADNLGAVVATVTYADAGTGRAQSTSVTL